MTTLKKPNLVLIRHGQSEWNQKNLFTGWVDISLSEQGIQEATKAGQTLKEQSFVFDLAFCSALKRSHQTLNYILKKMNVASIPVTKAWQLNERHYGQLQGQNKKDLVEQYGEQQVQKWRRSYNTKPPLLAQAQIPEDQSLYQGLKDWPLGESLQDTTDRVIPFWKNSILPWIQKGKTILVVAHGNSLRALIKHLDNISDEDITSLEIQTGKPLIYSLEQNKEIL